MMSRRRPVSESPYEFDSARRRLEFRAKMFATQKIKIKRKTHQNSFLSRWQDVPMFELLLYASYDGLIDDEQFLLLYFSYGRKPRFSILGLRAT